jgi:NADPH:quinone reductase-like Zn-dependent oxidoreductase
MRAIQIEAYGNPLELVKPVIAVEAWPVNQHDLMMISGNYGYRPQVPAITGTEGVGRAIAVGNAQTTPLSRLSAKRVSRSWYAASAKFARDCNRHGHV